MADDGARAALATAQHALLAALVTGAPAPAGFDADRLRVQADALLAKRRRTTAAHHPWLRDALGPRYAAHFTAWAAGHPRDPEGGARADAAAFEAHLRSRSALPPRPRRTAAAVLRAAARRLRRPARPAPIVGGGR